MVARRSCRRKKGREHEIGYRKPASLSHFRLRFAQDGKVKRLSKIPHGIEFPSSQEFLAAVDRFLELEMKKAGLGKDAVADVAISVTELVNNAILHGNRQDGKKTVTLELFHSPSEITIYVEDEGEGFDPEAVANPLEGENLLKEVGRGIFIARSLVDHLEFERGKRGGTRVKIVKKKSV